MSIRSERDEVLNPRIWEDLGDGLFRDRDGDNTWLKRDESGCYHVRVVGRVSGEEYILRTPIQSASFASIIAAGLRKLVGEVEHDAEMRVLKHQRATNRYR